MLNQNLVMFPHQGLPERVEVGSKRQYQYGSCEDFFIPHNMSIYVRKYVLARRKINIILK